MCETERHLPNGSSRQARPPDQSRCFPSTPPLLSRVPRRCTTVRRSRPGTHPTSRPGGRSWCQAPSTPVRQSRAPRRRDALQCSRNGNSRQAHPRDQTGCPPSTPASPVSRTAHVCHEPANRDLSVRATLAQLFEHLLLGGGDDAGVAGPPPAITLHGPILAHRPGRFPPPSNFEGWSQPPLWQGRPDGQWSASGALAAACTPPQRSVSPDSRCEQALKVPLLSVPGTSQQSRRTGTALPVQTRRDRERPRTRPYPSRATFPRESP